MPRLHPPAFEGGRPVLEFSQTECLGPGGISGDGVVNGPVMRLTGLHRFTFVHTRSTTNIVLNLLFLDENYVSIGSEQISAALAAGTNADVSFGTTMGGSTPSATTITRIITLAQFSFNHTGAYTVTGRLYGMPLF